jgi:hypothetical protein
MDGAAVRQQVNGRLWTVLDIFDLATDQMPILGLLRCLDVEGPPAG